MYETDFFKWTQEQAQRLKDRHWGELDLEHLIREVQELGDKRDEIDNRMRVLLMHLLKWQFQPSGRSPSWSSTIREQRRRIEQCFRRSPSLKNYLPEALDWAYPKARQDAAETGLSPNDFPMNCPYNLVDILDVDFLP